MKDTKRKPVLVDLGLQGGGAHGAFTWGVLDRLLEEPWLTYDGISGTSAGAMNAAVMVDGYAAGGADGARQALERFWRACRMPRGCSPMQRGPLEMLTGNWTLDYSPVFVAMDMAARLMSPYDTNPLRHQSAARRSCTTASTSIAWRRRRSSCSSPRPTCAPGRGRVFRNADVSRPTCCSPRPACRRCSRRSRSTASPTGTAAIRATRRMAPLIRECSSRDTIIVQINPIERPGTPRTAREIHNRLNEIAFNSVLIKELPGRGAAAAGRRSRHRREARCWRRCACIASPATSCSTWATRRSCLPSGISS